ncbi:retrovirus-related pol polyprotein from transposon TNT 1-94 [Tanacetum coccineum]
MAPCTSCSLGKLIARPLPLKVEMDSPVFLERIQGDICRPLHPPCGSFRYFMVLIDASSRWSHVSLLSTRNVAFAKFLAQIIKLKAHIPDYTVKHVKLDNAGEFTSQAFNDYCMSVGIIVEHPVAHVHTQNGLAESLIKRLQLIAKPLIMRTKLLVCIWGHAILHAAYLICIRPSDNHVYFSMKLAFGQEPNISHLRIFWCAIYVPIAPPNRQKWVLKEDCHFNEEIFPLFRGGRKTMRKMSHEVNLHYYTKRVTKSYIPAVNAPARVEIPNIKSDDKVTQESKARLKRRRPVDSKDKNPRKRKAKENAIIHEDIVLEGTQNVAPPQEEIDDINKEISINYGHSKISLD